MIDQAALQGQIYLCACLVPTLAMVFVLVLCEYSHSAHSLPNTARKR